MYRKILVPLDGSNLSMGVLPAVRYLAGGLGLPVELLSVSDPSLLVAYAPATLGEALETAARSFPATVRLSQTIETGNPARAVVERARAEPDTLVAMATHGYSGAARWLLGSVAETVSHELSSDLLLVRGVQDDPADGGALRTILVPLDYSAAAEAILPTVTELAGLLEIEIVLIHATERFYAGAPETLAPAFGAIPNLKELWERDIAEAKKYLEEKAQQLRTHGCRRVDTRALPGGVDGAAGEIVDFAQKVPACLIAMSPHGRSGIGGWLMGSVSRKVVQHARRPVLMVKAPRAS